MQLALSTAVGLGTGLAGAWLLAPPSDAAPAPVEAPVMTLATVPGAEAIVELPPITTNLAGSGDAWARLELSLVFSGAPDAATATRVHADALAYLRTLAVHQIASPSGYLFMRSDLTSRARDLTDGAVTGVLVRTFLIE